MAVTSQEARPRHAALDWAADYERLEEEATRRFRRQLSRWCQEGFVDTGEAVRDFYQEAWLQVAEHPPDGPIEDPAGYVAGVMRNLYYRAHLRSRRPVAQPLVDGDSVGEHCVPAAEGPEERTIARVDLRLLLEVVGTLPDRERFAWILGWRDGCGHADIASALGCSRRTARLLCQKANRRVGDGLRTVATGAWCEQFRSMLVAIGRGWSIESARRQRLAAHLESCGTCRATLADVRRAAERAELPVIAIPAAGSLTFVRDWMIDLMDRSGDVVGRVSGHDPARGVEVAAGGTAGGGVAATGLLAAGGSKALVACLATGALATCVTAVTVQQNQGASHKRDGKPRKHSPAAKRAPLHAPSAGGQPLAEVAEKAAPTRRFHRDIGTVERHDADNPRPAVPAGPTPSRGGEEFSGPTNFEDTTRQAGGGGGGDVPAANAPTAAGGEGSGPAGGPEFSSPDRGFER